MIAFLALSAGFVTKCTGVGQASSTNCCPGPIILTYLSQ